MEKFEKREIEEEDDDEKKEQESAEAISGLKRNSARKDAKRKKASGIIIHGNGVTRSRQINLSA